MSDIKFKFVGWNNQDNHDKIWCSFEVENVIYCGWGRRGAKLQFKEYGNSHSYSAMRNIGVKEDEKYRKGYNIVTESTLYKMFPDFDAIVQDNLVEKIMQGAIK